MRIKLVFLVLLGVGLVRIATSQSASEKMTSSEPMSGKEMFGLYCAACHGAGALGDGPAVVGLKKKPPDLTTLSKRNGGKFPIFKVQQAISGDNIPPIHGTREMPVFGDMFRDIRRDEAFVKLRVGVLVDYVASIQKK